MRKKIVQGAKWCATKLKASWKWYKGLYAGRKWYFKSGVALVSAFIAFLLYLGMVDINFLWLFGKSPGWSTINNPISAQASEIYSADGKTAYKDLRGITGKR